MLQKHKRYLLYYLEWDWKTQPDWGGVSIAVLKIIEHQQLPVFMEFETGGDDYGVFIYAQSEEIRVILNEVDNLYDFLDAEFKEL